MAFSFVQDAVVSGTSSGVNSNTTAAFGSNVTSGNLLYAVVSWVGTATTLASCSNGVDTFAVALQKNDNSEGENMALCYTCASAGGFTTGITATLTSSQSGTFFSVYGQEWSGGAASSCVDNSVGSILVSGGTSISNNITTSVANDLIVSGTNWNNSTGVVTLGSGFSGNGTHATTGKNVCGAEQQIATTATTYTASISWANAGIFAAQVVTAFKPSGASLIVDEDFWINQVLPVPPDSVISVF